MITDQQLEKINRFTRRELSSDEVYIFSAVLCDNDIDRDGERFSDRAIEALSKLFIGKTGIFDHEAKSSNQTARIFDTEIAADSSRKTKTGEVYKCLKAYAYMLRTDENRSLIAEIDGGIKKEVSISCTAAKKICSVCGCDKSKVGCAHAKGKSYGGKLCFTVLDDITDAYEWSFVAVPAQVNAGVTKLHTTDGEIEKLGECVKAANEELRRDIRRLAFVCGGTGAAKFASRSAEMLDTQQLIELKKSFEMQRDSSGITVQLAQRNDDSSASDGFSLR